MPASSKVACGSAPAAEPEHPGPTPNDQPSHPLPRPGRLHAQVQPVAVAIEPGLGGPHKRGAQALREAPNAADHVRLRRGPPCVFRCLPDQTPGPGTVRPHAQARGSFVTLH